MRYSFLLGLVIFICSNAAAQSDSTLVVELTGISSADGYVMVALYDEADTWMEEPLAHYSRRQPAQVGAVRIEFAHLAPGRYAIAAFHDKDSNGELNTGLFGIPQEPYGFGQDARGMFGAPSFEEASIVFERRGKAVVALK